jgi:hypothetical protein
MELLLNIRSAEGTRQIAVTQDRLTIGRGDTAEVSIRDSGLSRLHASINRQGERVWILDEGSANGTYVNGKVVLPTGTPLEDGDEISIGDQTTLMVAITRAKKVSASHQTPQSTRPRLQLSLTVMLIIAVLAIAAVIGSRFARRAEQPAETPAKTSDGEKKDTAPAIAKRSPAQPLPEEPTNQQPPIQQPPVIETGSVLYRYLKEEDKRDFIDRRARHISMMMSSREYEFPPETLGYIKEYVDNYARRVGNNSTGLWGEDMRFVLNRASKYAPFIVRSFNARGVPPVVGLYIGMIETEYHHCLTSPVGAEGILQLMPATARQYGLDPKDRCDAEKLTAAAAKYIKDRIAEFGTDSMSVALGIAGYNRSPDSIRRDLHDVIDPANTERSFWTLVANKAELDHWFQNENVRYVPKFFAAAIVGETPQAFGIQMKSLSTSNDVRE